jgi:hypothetical protein
VDKFDIIIEVQKIINNYDSLPHNDIVKDSLSEEIAQFIGQNTNSLEDIKYIMNHIDLSEWENENVNK